ncbi:MAG: flagellar biosynthetic protein FliP [Phycisphaerales bacterium]|nr:MAG: flagellar biosynthetic protein FliP [Phycisphaerales bacterium]
MDRRTALAVLFACAALAQAACGQTSPPPNSIDNSVLGVPDVRGVIPPAVEPEGVSATLRILVLMTVLTLVPSILVMTTAFPRIVIVLGLLRQALGTPQLPPGQVLLGLSLFLTMLIMAPTWHKINEEAVTPYFDNAPGLTQRRAIDISLKHMRDFMFAQIQKNDADEDVYLFLEYALGRPIDPGRRVVLEPDPEDEEAIVVPTTALIPAFMLSELKSAFVMGFKFYLPFLVIDMVIASILISMGMMMLPPVLISLPFKLMLFVLADGWHMVVRSLLYSFA